MTTTANKLYTLPTIGGDFNTWGDETNANWNRLDKNLGGTLFFSVAGNSDITITTDQAENIFHVLTGTLTGNIHYILPAIGGIYIIDNGTSGAFTLTIKTAVPGNSVIVPQGGALSFLVTEGINVAFAAPPSTASAPSWHNVSGSRAFATSYTNSTGALMTIAVTAQNGNPNACALNGFVGGALIVLVELFGSGGLGTLYVAVPAGATYQVNDTSGLLPAPAWYELY